MYSKDQFTIEDFQVQLRLRLSAHSARMTFTSALISSGLDTTLTVFNREETKTLCLAMINRGGPSFQVGKEMYKQILSFDAANDSDLKH